MSRVAKTFYYPRRLFVFISLATFHCVAGQQPSSTPTPSPIVHGSFQLPEISAAGFVGGRLLVAADDLESNDGFHMIDCLTDAVARLAAGKQITSTPEEQIYRDILLLLPNSAPGQPDAKRIADVEDAAVAPDQSVYLISSHSRTRKDKLPPGRTQLLRLRFNSESTKPTSASLSSQSLISRLPKELQEALTRRPGARDDQGRYTPGLNIEGLAWAPENDLLIGLRSPLIESKAVVLRMKSVDATFDRPTTPAATMPITIEATLDLQGMGIRGMCYDEKEKGYWIIAGISPDPDEPDEHLPNNWKLWFWNSKHELRRRFNNSDLPQDMRLGNPEAVCVVRKNDADYYLLLISDDDKGKPSSYVLVSSSELK